MNIEKMREEFEAAYLADITARTASTVDDGWLERNSNGDYRSYRAAGAWWGWQASRESLVIELPKRCDKMDGIAVYAEEGDFYHRHDIRELIEAAGLKVKP